MKAIARKDGSSVCIKSMIGEFEISLMFDSPSKKPLIISSKGESPTEDEELTDRHLLVRGEILIFNGEENITEKVHQEIYGTSSHSFEASPKEYVAVYQFLTKLVNLKEKFEL